MDVATIVREHAYWHPPAAEQNAWPCQEILPRGGAFLEEHKSHDIQYLDEKYLAEQWKLGDEWRQVKASR